MLFMLIGIIVFLLLSEHSLIKAEVKLPQCAENSISKTQINYMLYHVSLRIQCDNH